jgi:hypothetical protein
LKVLLAAQVPLSGLDGSVPKKKLNLFELASCLVAQTSTRSAQIDLGARAIATASFNPWQQR